MNLASLLSASARRAPEAVAVVDLHGPTTYGELDREAGRFASRFGALGVQPGDRVAIWAEKSARTIAAMQGALRIGAAYVPVDPLSPVPRALMVMQDCKVRCVVTTSAQAARLEGLDDAAVVTLDGPSESEADEALAPPTEPWPPGDDRLAYILYTSGSTGRPKGVCISHTNAWAFIEWAHDTIRPGPEDRFSNHAPFHFDLSVLDLYVAFMCGARVCLVPDGTSYLAANLLRFLDEHQITVWYSVPTALIMMMDKGLLEQDRPWLRVVLFAGEPFPLAPLCRMMERWPDKRFLNLYGPTETNVCTAWELPEPPHGLDAIPIGTAASGDTVWAEDEDGNRVGPGGRGQLVAAGPTVMLGYWGKAQQGAAPYYTGDRVRVLEDGVYEYIGRMDNMVKIRGHRVELGEIEHALESHEAVREAIAAVREIEGDKFLVAYLLGEPDHTPPSLLKVKRLLSQKVPRYMIVDRIFHFDEFPRTRNGKVDRRRLAEWPLTRG